MDFSYLLEIAKQNSDKAGKKVTVKRYTTDLKPARKEAKGNVRSSAIKAFLARKEEEEKQKEVEAKQKKTELLSLRAQSTKNCKKAKLMTSRTKDNDYSKIKLSEEEEQSKKQREIELQRRMITDKIERMKARIEMEEKEKLLPRKRKRKTHLKTDDVKEKLNVDDEIERYLIINDAEPDQSQSMKEQKKKMPAAAPPPMNFHDLLKLASKKQHEPIPAPKIVKTQERPMTEKEKRLHEEEELRKKGKSVYSLPQYNKTKKGKANSENNINKTSISSTSSNGPTHQQHLKHVNNVNVNGKSAPITERRLISHNENSRPLDNRKLPGHTSKLKNNLSRKPSEYSEDEEEDDDLSDFIDNEEEEYDVSSQIREIFKYDRNRYISDDDDDIMETPFSEQMKEECRSAKIGRQEDLEDMRREEEEERLRKLKRQKNTR